ncbi:hypothetical protein VTN00DRAFT_885 [Thermoascus crustaceus]|uniref:uncharacterized protein n=1 Tax=Thermoascus crustaceus TaxID=5088 RepID=UPI0037423F30
MKNVVAVAAFAAGANALVGRSNTCCFGLSASGGVSGTIGQLGDGQNRVRGGLPPAQFCIDSSGAITDSSGRGCILTPPPAVQFQCDLGAKPTPGFSISSEGTLKYHGSSQFYACETGENGGMNLYTSNDSSAQTGCKEITLMADSCKGQGSSSSSPSVSVAPQSSAPASTSKPAAPQSSAPGYGSGSQSAPAPGYTAPGSGSQPSPAPGSSGSGSCSSPSPGSGSGYGSGSQSAPAPGSSAPGSDSGSGSASQSAPAPGYTAPGSGSGSNNGSGSQSAPAPGATAPGSSSQPSPAPESSAPASGSQPAPTQASSAPSAPQPSETQSAGSGSSGSGCPANLSGPYEYPHLIIPVDSSSPDKAAGTQYNGTITSSVSTLFNFDIPQSDAGKKCSLVFLFPKKEDLETSSYSFSGDGKLEFASLQSPAAQDTCYSNAPAVKEDYGVFTVSPGNSYTIATFDCPAGQAVGYKISNAGSTELNYFQDWNPSPLGLYITKC